MLDDEPILGDLYPVYIGYFYVADGKVVKSLSTGTVADLKSELGVREIRKCSVKRFYQPKHPTPESEMT